MPRTSQNKLKIGTWNFICDICGEKYKAEDAERTWDGYVTCPSCYDPKHPQIELRGIKDNQSVPWTRPDVEYELTDSGNINLETPTDATIDLVSMGKADTIVFGELIDTDADFVTEDVQAGDRVFATDISDDTGASGTYTSVVSVDDLHTLTLQDNLFTRAGQHYKVRRYSLRIRPDDLGRDSVGAGIGSAIIESTFIVG